MATRDLGKAAIPHEGFDAEQESMVFEQADELMDLQTEGYIAHLSTDLSHVFDLRSAMKLAPKQPDVND